MEIKYPHTIESCIGEKIIMRALQPEPDGDRLLVENFVMPGQGPLMHIHWLQDECLTVVKGKIGYQVEGHPEQFAHEGETVLFERGLSHRFWNAGTEVLHCHGWIKPANTFPFFISSIFAAQNKTGSARPEMFDVAYLLTRYSKEYKLSGMPVFVRKIIIPVVYVIGKLSGKYKKFRNAPSPVTS